MENQYFKRTINEGSVKATHVCSFDSSIVLTKLVQRGKKVIDAVITAAKNVEDNSKTRELSIKEELMNRLASIRFNGKEIVLEDLGECFDDDEIVEVITFINGGDMSKFGGKSKTETEIKEEELKNA